MEKSEISIHLAKVYLASKKESWFTAKDIAAKTDIAYRTASQHCRTLVNLGVFDLAEVFPGHRYRLSDMATKRNLAYCQRLELALNIFDLG